MLLQFLEHSFAREYIYLRLFFKKFSCFLFSALGAGAIKSNLAVFGAEQIRESKITSRYFDKYMVAINIGAMFATLAIPFIQNGDDKSIFIKYVVAAGTLFIAAILFLIGCRYYIHIKTNETVVTNCIPVVINAFQSWYQYKKNARSIDKKHITSSRSDLLNDSHSLAEEEESMRIDEQRPTFLDFAKAVNHGKYHDRIVDDVKSLRSAIIVFTLLIPYWLIYNQVREMSLEHFFVLFYLDVCDSSFTRSTYEWIR